MSARLIGILFAFFILTTIGFIVIQLGKGLLDRKRFYTQFFHKGFRDQLLTKAELHELGFEYRLARDDYSRLREWFSKSFEPTKLDRKIRGLDGIIATIGDFADRTDKYLSDRSRLPDAIRWCLQLVLLDPNESRWRVKLKDLTVESERLEKILSEARRLAGQNDKREGQKLLLDARNSALEVVVGDVLPEGRDDRGATLWNAIVLQTQRIKENEHRARLRHSTGAEAAGRLVLETKTGPLSQLEALAGRLALLLNRDQRGLAEQLISDSQSELLKTFGRSMIAAGDEDSVAVKQLLPKLSRLDSSGAAIAALVLNAPILDAFETGDKFVTLTIDSQQKAEGFVRHLVDSLSYADLEWPTDQTKEEAKEEATEKPTDQANEEAEEEPMNRMQFIPDVITSVVKRYGSSPHILTALESYRSDLKAVIGEEFPWERLEPKLDVTTRDAVLAFQDVMSEDEENAKCCRHWIESFDITALSDGDKNFLCDRVLGILDTTPSDPLTWRLIPALSAESKSFPQVTNWLRRKMTNLLDEKSSKDIATASAILSVVSKEAPELLGLSEIKAPLAQWLTVISGDDESDTKKLESLTKAKAISEELSSGTSATSMISSLRASWSALQLQEIQKAKGILQSLETRESNSPAVNLLCAHILEKEGSHTEALKLLESLSEQGLSDNQLTIRIVESFLSVQDWPSASRGCALALRAGTANRGQIDTLTRLMLTAEIPKIKPQQIRDIEEFLTALVTYAPITADQCSRSIQELCDRYSTDNLTLVKALFLTHQNEAKAAAQILSDLAGKPTANPRLLLLTLWELDNEGAASIPSHIRSTIRDRIRDLSIR